MRWTSAVCALLFACVVPSLAPAHPHVWVSGGAQFGVDDQGRLERLHVTWIYDQFASIYLLSYLKVDQDNDGKLTDDDKKKILADQTNWPKQFQGDSYLFVDGKKQPLSGPVEADVVLLEDGRVAVSFQRTLEAPFRPAADGPEVIAKVYDPTFYYAYEITTKPDVVGPDGHGCTAVHKPYDANDPKLKALAVELSAIGRDETPDQQDVGALFADELQISCS